MLRLSCVQIGLRIVHPTNSLLLSLGTVVGQQHLSPVPLLLPARLPTATTAVTMLPGRDAFNPPEHTCPFGVSVLPEPEPMQALTATCCCCQNMGGFVAAGGWAASGVKGCILLRSPLPFAARVLQHEHAVLLPFRSPASILSESPQHSGKLAILDIASISCCIECIFDVISASAASNFVMSFAWASDAWRSCTCPLRSGGNWRESGIGGTADCTHTVSAV